jgi:hypothetical protein
MKKEGYETSAKLDVIINVLMGDAVLSDNVRLGLAEILSEVRECLAREKAYYEQMKNKLGGV